MKKRITFYPGKQTERELTELKALGIPYSKAVERACQEGIRTGDLLQIIKGGLARKGGK